MIRYFTSTIYGSFYIIIFVVYFFYTNDNAVQQLILITQIKVFYQKICQKIAGGRMCMSEIPTIWYLVAGRQTLYFLNAAVCSEG